MGIFFLKYTYVQFIIQTTIPFILSYEIKLLQNKKFSKTDFKEKTFIATFKKIDKKLEFPTLEKGPQSICSQFV